MTTEYTYLDVLLVAGLSRVIPILGQDGVDASTGRPRDVEFQPKYSNKGMMLRNATLRYDRQRADRHY